MVRVLHAVGLVGLLALTGCALEENRNGPPTPPPEPPEGTEINTPGIESYTTTHNGYSRARIDNTTSAADDAILAQFDDGNPRDPAGYRNLISLTEDRYRNSMQIEVVAEVMIQDGEEQVVRILRLTADQAPFDNVDAAGNTIASGQFYFRGSAEIYSTLNDGPLQRGVGDLENMIVDFDTESVSINIRTPFNAEGGSQQISVENIPFNVVTGAFGGPVTMVTRPDDTTRTITTRGTLRGNLSADEENLRNQGEGLTTSGLFTIGNDNSDIQADGVFWGRHPNTFN